MEIKSLRLKGYRCFTDEVIVDFSIPDGSIGSGLTTIVGPNNSGKSSIIGGLSLLFSNTNDIPRNVRNNSDLKISITDSKDETYMITYDEGVNRFKNNNRVINDSFKFDTNITFINKYSSIDVNLFKNNRTLIDLAITKILGFCPEYIIEGDHIEVDGLSLGNGISRLFSIVSNVINNDIICIDEPEISLYPGVQVKLMDFLIEESRYKQIILCTYSTNFVGDNIIRIDNGIYPVHGVFDKNLCFLNKDVIICSDVAAFNNLFMKYNYQTNASLYKSVISIKLVLDDLKNMGYKNVFVINDQMDLDFSDYSDYYIYNIPDYYNNDEEMDNDLRNMISEMDKYFSSYREITNDEFGAKEAIYKYINEGNIESYIKSKYPHIEFNNGKNEVVSFKQVGVNTYEAIIDSYLGINMNEFIHIKSYISLDEESKSFSIKRKVIYNSLPVSGFRRVIERIKF